MLFTRKNMMTVLIGILCIALVPGLVFAQQTFGGVSKRLQGLEPRIFGEIAVVKRVVDDSDPGAPTVDSLEGYIRTVGDHAYLDPTTCSLDDTETVQGELHWTGTAWTCRRENDPTVKTYAKTDLPTCNSAQALTNKTAGGGVMACANLPAAETGDRPDHSWSGTSVRFESNYGTWGSYTNLRGPQGVTGVCP